MTMMTMMVVMVIMMMWAFLTAPEISQTHKHNRNHRSPLFPRPADLDASPKTSLITKIPLLNPPATVEKQPYASLACFSWFPRPRLFCADCNLAQHPITSSMLVSVACWLAGCPQLQTRPPTNSSSLSTDSSIERGQNSIVRRPQPTEGVHSNACH
jgi:hypothetical protein